MLREYLLKNWEGIDGMKFTAYFKKYSPESKDGWVNVLFPNGSCCIDFDADVEFIPVEFFHGRDEVILDLFPGF